MSVCAFKLAKTIQVYQILCILFLFAIDVVDLMYLFSFFFIDTVVDEMIVSFHYACKIERLLCKRLIDTSC